MSTTVTRTGPELDPAELVWSARGLLQTFNRAGVVGPADVHTAVRVGRVAGEADESVRLALALVVRALRSGSVCLDLDRAATTVLEGTGGDELPVVDAAELPWPDPATWRAACAGSPLVAVGPDAVGDRPLRLVIPGDSPGESLGDSPGGEAGDGAAPTRLYLERYWQQEELVRTQLRDRRARPAPVVDLERLRTGLDRLFAPADASGLPAGEPDQQRLAAAVGVLRWVSVLAGGPGTGKTTTVARLLALLRDQQPGVRIALAAPTGKAAARLQEAVRAEAAKLSAVDQERLGDLSALTLDRLLGWLPGRRYRHHADNHLPYDVIVVDETSMVSLTMMSRFLDAVRPQARIVFVGDPDQLSSVEAGAVLADVVNAPVAPDPALTEAVCAVGAPATSTAVVRLRHTWRFAGTISRLAAAVRDGDADEAVAALRAGAGGSDADVVFVETDLERATGADLPHLVRETVGAGRAVWDAGHRGDVAAALEAMDRHRLVCTHRQGPYGVARWSREVEHWLAQALQADPLGQADSVRDEWYPGRPLMITANDYELGVYNGDTGAVVATPQGPRAAFARGGAPVLVAPVRLESVQTLHAMTVHKAQGSQFRSVSLLLPPADSPLLTRELLYTAVTRAEERVYVYGTEDAVRRAVTRPANRATGLRERLA